MNKRIYLILLSIVVIFFSCKDTSGEFEEQLFTNTQINIALKDCFTAMLDSTCHALFTVDTLSEKYGYYYYDSKAYRIELPESAKQIIDTLVEYGFSGTIDTLIMHINRAAEQCGNSVKSYWEPVIKGITFPTPFQTLHGEKDAITNYVKTYYQSEFVNTLKNSALKERFNAFNVVLTWNMLQEEYYKITEHYTTIDMLEFSAQQMAIGFFKKMAIEEAAIRTNPELRGVKDGWLYKVFATL
jgi:hypothetical protein